jgi:hypothetical protein
MGCEAPTLTVRIWEMAQDIIAEIKAALDEPFIAGWDIINSALILILMLVLGLSWHSLQSLM